MRLIATPAPSGVEHATSRALRKMVRTPRGVYPDAGGDRREHRRSRHYHEERNPCALATRRTSSAHRRRPASASASPPRRRPRQPVQIGPLLVGPPVGASRAIRPPGRPPPVYKVGRRRKRRFAAV